MLVLCLNPCHLGGVLWMMSFLKKVYFYKITCFVVADDDNCAFGRVGDGYGLLVRFLPYVWVLYIHRWADHFLCMFLFNITFYFIKQSIQINKKERNQVILGSIKCFYKNTIIFHYFKLKSK